MGIKNRKEKAIFNKHQKKLGTKNSPFLNANESTSKELSKIKTIKFSKEFVEFRNKSKPIYMEDENHLEDKDSKLVNMQTNNGESLERFKESSKGHIADTSNTSSFYKKNNIVNNKTNNHTSNKFSKYTNIKSSEDISKSRKDSLRKEKIIKDNLRTNLNSKVLVRGPGYRISKTINSEKENTNFEKSKPSKNIEPSIKSKKLKFVDKSQLISKGLDNKNKENISESNLFLEGLRKEKVIKDLKNKETLVGRGEILVSNFSKTNIKDKVGSGSETDDIGVKSLSSTNQNFKDFSTLVRRIRSKNKSRIISKNTKHFNHRKIRTKMRKREPTKDLYIKTKVKEEVIKDMYKESARSKVIKTRIELVKDKLMQIGQISFSKGLVALFLVLFLFTTIFAVGNGNISTSASFVVLTTDEQNEAYLQYYEELKVNLKEEIDDLTTNTNHDYVVIDGLDPNGNLYDLDFTEWIAILTVEIEQDFKLSNYEYKYLKEIFNRMIYYKAHVETETSTDSEGNTETTTTLVITVINEYYPQIKDYLGFNNEDLEWVERLIEYDSLSDRIDNIPSNSEYVDGSGNLSPEEIEKYGGQMVHPLNGLGRISSPYGYRVHPIHGTRKFHSGIDLAIGQGSPIYSAQDGVVIHSGPMGGYGLTIMIQHDNGVVTLYAHCSSLVARVDLYVSKGDHISNVGSTGQSTGPHLHFEVRVDGSTVNPHSFINH